MTPSIDELVSLARTAFARAADREDREREAAMLELGRRVGELGRLAAFDAPAVRRFVADTAGQLDRLPLPAWLRALGRAVEPMTTEDDEYLYALTLRSHVELFKALYRDAAPEAVERLDTSEIDETLGELAHGYHVAVIPADIPASHTWWHRHAAPG